MKKPTKLQTVPKESGEEHGSGTTPVRQHGPVKEKTQITIRVDQQLMNEAYAQMREDNTRITDIIERGIYLALRERDHDMPVWTKQIRFVLANATREQQALLRGLAIAMVEVDVLAAKKKPGLSAEEEKLLEVVKWVLASRNRVAHALDCLQWYSRYGKSAEEIAQLGRL